MTRLWGLEGAEEFDRARRAGANVLGSDYVDPNRFEYSDSTDPNRGTPSFTILDAPEPSETGPIL